MPISELVTIIMDIWVGKLNKLKTDLCLRMTKVRGKLDKSFPKRNKPTNYFLRENSQNKG